MDTMETTITLHQFTSILATTVDTMEDIMEVTTEERHVDADVHFIGLCILMQAHY